MFSSSVRRAALSTPPPPIPSNLAASIPRAATSQTLSSRCHQRRASSSKPSSPANGPKKIGDEAAVASAASNQASAKSSTPKNQSNKKAKSAAAKSTVKGRDESMLHLPSVPSTQHITPLQLGASAFFSLHRPMSLTHGFPKPVTDEAFATIFTPRTKSNKTAEVIDTLSNTVKKLDTVTGKLEAIKLRGQQEQWNEKTDEIRAAITAESYLNAETEQSEGTREESVGQLQQLITSKYQPFNPPPIPTPLNTTESLAAGAEAAESLELEPQHRTYTTVLTIEESTDSNGDVTWTAHHSPIVPKEAPTTPTRFLERMRTRREQYKLNRKGENDMLLISVKRQRKLKMKKHKYKKLMRRTRNLRRRLDRT